MLLKVSLDNMDILENICCVQNSCETKQAHPLGKLNLLTTALFPPLATATSGNSMNSCLNNKTFVFVRNSCLNNKTFVLSCAKCFHLHQCSLPPILVLATLCPSNQHLHINLTVRCQWANFIFRSARTFLIRYFGNF